MSTYRTSSSDFQQLRHIWEAHHQSPEGEMLALPSFLSRSQSSLHTSTDSPVAAAGSGGTAAPTTVSRMSSSVDSIAVSVYDLYKYGLWLRGETLELLYCLYAMLPGHIVAKV